MAQYMIVLLGTKSQCVIMLEFSFFFDLEH